MTYKHEKLVLVDDNGGTQNTTGNLMENGTIIDYGWNNIHNDPIVAKNVQVEDPFCLTV